MALEREREKVKCWRCRVKQRHRADTLAAHAMIVNMHVSYRTPGTLGYEQQRQRHRHVPMPPGGAIIPGGIIPGGIMPGGIIPGIIPVVHVCAAGREKTVALCQKTKGHG